MMSILWNVSTYNLGLEEYIPILSMSNLPGFDKPKVDIYNIVFNNIPIMHPHTPIEHILEFKSNKDNQGRLLQFRSFVNKLSKEGLSEIEIQQEIEHLMHQYKQAMELHKINSISGVLNVGLSFVVSAAYTAMAALGALMNIKVNNINLATSEMSYPGREISYLYNAGKTLGPIK